MHFYAPFANFIHGWILLHAHRPSSRGASYRHRAPAAACPGAPPAGPGAPPEKEGHEVTQSSVSRDLRELGVLKASGRYVLPVARKCRANPGQFRRRSRSSCARHRTAGPSITVVRTTIGRRAERGRGHRQGRLARSRRHHLRRRHHFHRHRRRAARRRELIERLRAALPSLTMPNDCFNGRQAHRPRLFRRPRHLVPRAVGGGELRPADHHRHRRHRRHRRAGGEARWRSARRRSAPSSITSSMRARTTSSRCCASSSWATCGAASSIRCASAPSA